MSDGARFSSEDAGIIVEVSGRHCRVPCNSTLCP